MQNILPRINTPVLMLGTFLLVNLCLFPVHTLFPMKLYVNSPYFSQDQEFLRVVRQNAKNTNALKRRVSRYLAYHGYVFSSLQAVKYSNHSLFLNMDEGRIRAIHIFGDTKISRNILDAYIYYKPGDIFNKDKLRLQVKKLQGLNLFESINYKYIIPNKTIWVKITVKKKRYFQMDGNYTAQYGLMPYLGFVDRDLFSSRIYMDLNVECGFWDKFKYVKVNPRFMVRDYSLDLFLRTGDRYIDREDYSSDELRLSPGRTLTLSRSTSFFFSFPVENYSFKDTGNFPGRVFLNGWRFGVSTSFIYNNRRDVIEPREETMLRLELDASLLPARDYYVRTAAFFKTYWKFLSYGGLLYRSSFGYLGHTRCLDKLFLIGGENQRGYVEGTAITEGRFENTLEFDHDIVFNLLKIDLFLDSSYFREGGGNRFLLSYGPGLFLNILSFNIQVYYGAPVKESFFSGNVYLNLSKIIY